jgi:hypothetical protein
MRTYERLALTYTETNERAGYVAPESEFSEPESSEVFGEPCVCQAQAQTPQQGITLTDAATFAGLIVSGFTIWDRVFRN